MTNTMKKLAALLMAAMMLMSLAACGKDDGNKDSGKDDKPGVSDSDKKGDDKTDGDKGDAALSEEDYKAKITEIGTKVGELTEDVTAAQTKAKTDPQGALKDLTDTVNEMKPLYQELADLKAPEKFADAQAKIKNGSDASVEVLDMTLEMMELAADPAKAAEAADKVKELTEKMTEYSGKVTELQEGLTEVLGA